MSNRRTVSYQERTHARLQALNEGFGDSHDKIANRLIDFFLKWKDKVDKVNK